MKQTTQKYKHAVIATDIIIFTVKESALKVLLIKMKKDPFKNHWAMPGGLVKADESVDMAAKRHLEDKTGVKDLFLEQLYTFGKVNRDPFGRVVSVSYFALIPQAEMKLKTTKEYEDIKWFSVNDLPELAYDHKEMLELGISRLRSKLEYTNIVCNLLPKEFTLAEMQNIYELILNKEIDKRNFRKKIETLKIVKDTGKKTSGKAHRPAKIYKFKDNETKNLQII